METTIILPCAGEGTRLNLDYPKELFEIYTGKKLIDFSIDQINNIIKTGKANVKVSVVITRKKEEVFNYVNSKLSNIETNKIYFNNKYLEWPGSVFSAKETFSEYNLVLLPDTYFSLSRDNTYSNSGKSLIDLIQKNMKIYDVVFGYVSTKDKNKLMNLGALKIEEDKVVLFKDKPTKNLDFYNAFWGCYAFNKDAGEQLYKFLINSIITNDIVTNLIFPRSMGGFPIFSYYDLGTRNGIDEFLSSEPNCSRNISGKP